MFYSTARTDKANDKALINEGKRGGSFFHSFPRGLREKLSVEPQAKFKSRQPPDESIRVDQGLLAHSRINACSPIPSLLVCRPGDTGISDIHRKQRTQHGKKINF